MFDERSIGIHLLIQAAEGGKQFPIHDKQSIHEAIEQASTLHGCPLKATNILDDHVHILVLASDEFHASGFINSAMERITAVVQDSVEGFTLSEDIHVTLLPPWHVDILASFVRDQVHYHETRTVEQELDEVFRPNAIPDMGTAPSERSLGAVN